VSIGSPNGCDEAKLKLLTAHTAQKAVSCCVKHHGKLLRYRSSHTTHAKPCCVTHTSHHCIDTAFSHHLCGLPSSILLDLKMDKPNLEARSLSPNQLKKLLTLVQRFDSVKTG